MSLQHLRSSTANKRPVPGNMSDGQIAINTNTGSPGLFFKDSNNTLVKVGPVHVGTTAPNASPAAGGTAGNSVGEQWLDTTGGTYVFKVWDGSAWRSESGTFVDVNGDVMTGALGIIAGSAAAPGLYISGDANTGLYSPGSDQLALATGGSERLRITSAGLVGVGTSNAQARLHVQSARNTSQVFLTADGIVNPGDYLQYGFGANSDTGSGLYGAIRLAFDNWAVTDATNLQFHVRSGEKARIDSSGRVGIGTSGPSSLLELAGAAASSTVAATVTNTDPSGFTNLILRNTGTSGKNYQLVVGGNNSASPNNFYLFDSSASAVRLLVDTSGRVGIGTTSPGTRFQVRIATNKNIGFDLSNGEARLSCFDDAVANAAPLVLNGSDYRFEISSNERARIDSSGRLLVGTSSARSNLPFAFGNAAARLQVEGTGEGQGAFAVIQNFDSATTGVPAVFNLARSGATSVGSNTAIASGNQLGEMQFSGSDGTNFIRAASIRGEVDGTPGANDMPGRIVLSTTADGATSPTPRVTIDSQGYVRLSASSPGIQFGGDTAAANALDDYEEGTFTPTIVGTSTAGTATYGANGQQGRYTKIGNRVFFDLYLAWSAHTGTGDLQINGLPFTVQNTTNLNRTFSAIFSSVALTAGSIGAAFSSPNTTTIALRQLPTGGGSVATVPMDTSAQISISGSFDV